MTKKLDPGASSLPAVVAQPDQRLANRTQKRSLALELFYEKINLYKVYLYEAISASDNINMLLRPSQK